MVDMHNLTRNENFIRKTCKKVGKSLVATKEIRVYIPCTLENNKLLFLDERIYTEGTILYTDGKEYAVMNLVTLIELSAVDYHRVAIKGFDGKESGTECYEFIYTKGDKIHPTNEVTEVAVLAYDVINHHILLGKSVPFFDKGDIDGILDSIPRFCGFGLPEYGYTNLYPEMIVRDPSDLQVPSRISKSKYFQVVPFSNIILNVSSTIGKNRGNRLEDGILSATVTTAETTTPFEDIMRA